MRLSLAFFMCFVLQLFWSEKKPRNNQKTIILSDGSTLELASLQKTVRTCVMHALFTYGPYCSSDILRGLSFSWTSLKGTLSGGV